MLRQGSTNDSADAGIGAVAPGSSTRCVTVGPVIRHCDVVTRRMVCPHGPELSPSGSLGGAHHVRDGKGISRAIGGLCEVLVEDVEVVQPVRGVAVAMLDAPATSPS